MIGECEPDTNSVDDTAEPDWDESSDESSDDSSDDLPELEHNDMPELVYMPLPIASSRAVRVTQGNFRGVGEGEAKSSPPENGEEASRSVRPDRLIPLWAVSHNAYPAWLYAQYRPIGHTHNDIDQILHAHRCAIPNGPQRVPPFPSLQTDNAPGELKSYLRAML